MCGGWGALWRFKSIAILRNGGLEVREKGAIRCFFGANIGVLRFGRGGELGGEFSGYQGSQKRVPGGLAGGLDVEKLIRSILGYSQSASKFL
jgi:hypothetical protein